MFRRFAFRTFSFVAATYSRRRLPFYVIPILAVGTAVSSKSTVRLDSPVSSNVHVDSGSVKDTATDIEFPAVLKIPSRFPLPQYTLLGVGVRKVSIFGIKVYSAALYADLSKIPPLDPSSTTEEKISRIIENTSCVIRIVPTRNTSFSHLRDGFMRALQARLSAQKRQHLITEEEENRIVTPMLQFKSLFPNTAMEKHVPLDVILIPPTSSQEARLIVRDLGSVTSTWLVREFALAYFDGEGISPPLKQAVTSRLNLIKN